MVVTSKNRESLILMRRCQAEGKEISTLRLELQPSGEIKQLNLVNGIGPIKKHIGPASLEGAQMRVLVVVTY